MYLFSTPRIIKKLLGKNLVWEMNKEGKTIYLTFDDGPEPEVTPWVLETLRKYNAKATFFCLGKNAENHPAIVETIIRSGHTVGNHTYCHLKGWKTDTSLYIADIEKCDSILKTPFFRPPYGKIKPSQLRLLKGKYKVIMWTLLTCDFDASLDKDKCLDVVLKKTKSGSIIIFHDSLKAREKLQYVLPRLLEHFSKEGYDFLPLS